MGYRKSRRSRRGGSALSPAVLGGRRRSRRSRRGGSLGVGYALAPAAVSGLVSTANGGDRNIPFDGTVGQGITSGGLLGTTLTAGGRRSRRSRRSRRDRR